MGRYRKHNEKENAECKDCKIPIWVRDDVHTTYHGKSYHWNEITKKEPCSYMTNVKNTDGTYNSGAVCVKCFDTNYEVE